MPKLSNENYDLIVAGGGPAGFGKLNRLVKPAEAVVSCATAAPDATDAAPYDIVILSANAANLAACIGAIQARQPGLDASNIIVVDDGARADAQQNLPGVRWVQGIKPFNFARNANLGIAASTRDIILLNDDALLLTHGGFAALAEVAHEHGYGRAPGAVAAAVEGVVGNPRQKAQGGNALRTEPRQLCFICVYLPRATLEAVGELDIRFDGYGYDDDDYCDRIRAAGLEMAVYDGCVVDHSGVLPSSFRTRHDFHALNERNRQLYREKQASAVAPVEHAEQIEVSRALRVNNE